jgi:chromosome segregation ATPase
MIDKQMTKGKKKNLNNTNQGYMASSEPTSPTTRSPGYPKTLEKQDLDLKSNLMVLIWDFKKDINNFVKEIQNIGKQVEELKNEKQKSLKELQESTMKQVKELNKNTQDLKMEVETIKKSQKTTVKIENLGKNSGHIYASITNIIQEIEERISGAEDSIENIDTTIKENAKCKKIQTQNIHEIQDTMRRSKLRIISIEESEDSNLNGQ